MKEVIIFRHHKGSDFPRAVQLKIDKPPDFIAEPLQLTKIFSVTAQYTTVPEFRQSENRIRAGFRVDTKHLWVMPLYSFGVGSSEVWRTKGKRVSVSLGVKF